MAEPKKETVRIALPPRPDQTPLPPSVAKRDTARIVLPSRTPVRRLPPKITPLPAAGSATEPTTISLRRPPVTPPGSSSVSPLLQPLPKPPGSEMSADSGAASAPLPHVLPARDEAGTQSNPTASIHPGPKKETARISALPRPAAAPAPSINMTKTQPLLIRPGAAVQPGPLVTASKPAGGFDSIPKSFCWALLGIAALIFLIQILNYVVS